MVLWALILDDDKKRHQEYRYRLSDCEQKIVIDHCTTANACIVAMSKKKYKYIFLDHDYF